MATNKKPREMRCTVAEYRAMKRKIADYKKRLGIVLSLCELHQREVSRDAEKTLEHILREVAGA